MPSPEEPTLQPEPSQPENPFEGSVTLLLSVALTAGQKVGEVRGKATAAAELANRAAKLAQTKQGRVPAKLIHKVAVELHQEAEKQETKEAAQILERYQASLENAARYEDLLYRLTQLRSAAKMAVDTDDLSSLRESLDFLFPQPQPDDADADANPDPAEPQPEAEPDPGPQAGPEPSPEPEPTAER